MLKSTPKMLMMMSSMFITSSLMLTITNMSYILEWEMCTLITSCLNINMMMEWSSLLYCSIIMFISSMVLKFSKDYMKNDKNKLRFWMLVLLFIMSMNLLILIPNMMTLLIGWDGLGITSFILIIYYNNQQSMSAGMFTMITNRMGDMFLLMSIISMLDNSNWLPLQPMMNQKTTIQSMGIMMAMMTKSAQLPYSSWLPAAMAAPTPVSALVHSSTLVTAGIFIMYRFNNLIINSTMTQTILLMSSLLTMLITSMSAMTEKDMKKIIALSTLSQLSLMTLCLSLKMFNLMYFHMVTHAIFKALLFICAGSMISINSHNQDTRLYGKYILMLPQITSSFLISSMAMIGMPFMVGYYSKHLIMEWSSMMIMNIMIYIIMMISIMLTSLYSMKLMMLIMLYPSLNKPLLSTNISKNNFHPTLLMSTMSICLAPIIQWSLPITTNPQMNENMQTSMINIIIMTSLMLTLLHTTSPNKIKKMHYMMNKFLYSLSFITPLSTKLMTFPYMNLSLQLYKSLDQSWLEKLSGMSMMPSFMNISFYLNKYSMTLTQKNLLSTTLMSMTSLALYYL